MGGCSRRLWHRLLAASVKWEASRQLGCEHRAEEGGRGAIDLFAIGRVGGLDALHEAVLTVPVRLAVVCVGSPAAWGGFSAVTAAGREH